MPNQEDSLGGETFSGEEQQDAAEQSLGDQSTFGDANVDDELFDDGMKLEDLSARYTEEGVLGKGGMGEVILATDTRLNRKVAIKRIIGKAARSKTAVQRFLTEAQSMAELSHTNIVQIYDYGRATDGPFLIMECIQGGSLLEKCKAGPIELDEAVNIFVQLCDGLAKAHAAGIIHRDIKPANVLMTEDGVPKLTDFGLAKDDTADTGMTMEGAVIGTLNFMPPEQRQAAELTDHRSDLWSLAATFYQMLTGKTPKVINITSLPPKLQSVVAKALEESKEDRFQSAMDMREAILQAHSGKMDISRTLGEGPRLSNMHTRFTNLLGTLVRKVAHRVIKRYYPRIQITGAERIPKTGPVLFCANHPNSLVDPILIGIAARRPVSFMAKAPLFKTPLLGPIIKALGMVPAYRGRDDARQVKKNSASLALVAKGLKAGRAMGIFPEGVSSDARQLGMVRSGAARIALEAFDNGVTDLIIIPLGINYDKKEQLGSKVWIDVGQPLDLASWIPEHSQNNEEPIAPSDDKRLRRKLTEELGTALKNVIVHVDNVDWDPLLTDLEIIFKRTKHKPSDQVPALMRRKRIADAINYYYEQDPATAEEIIGKVESYHRELRSAGLVIDDPILNRSRTYAIFTFLWQLAVLVLWFLPALFGSMMNMVPFLVTRKVSAKFQDDGQKTIATWRLVCGIPIYLMWYGIIYLTVLYETQQLPMAMMMNFILPITGSIALRYWPFFAKSMRHMGHQFRTLTNRKQLHDLREKLAGIRVTLIEYAEKYAEISPRPENTPTVRPFMMLFAKAIGTACFLAIAFVIYFYAANLVSSQFAPKTEATNPLASKSSSEVHESQSAATKELITIEQAYRNTLNKARELLAGYRAGNVQIENQQDSDQIQSLLHRYCTYRDSLLRILLTYRPYQDKSLFDNPQSQDRALVLFAAATLLRHEMSANFIEAHDGLPRVRQLLNLPETRWGIPAGVFDSVHREMLDTTYQDMIFAAETAYLQRDRFALKNSPLHNIIENSRVEIAGIPEFGIRASVNRALRDAKDNATDLYQYIQTFTATVVGDFKVNQREIDNLIGADDLHGFHQALKPGDMLIERRNWYASNAFLPGFWPHGAMYVGTVQEMKDAGIYELVRDKILEFADDDEKSEYKSGKAHAQSLRDILDEFERPVAENRYEHHHVIEAVSEGVVLNTIEHSAGEATSVCAFRPVLLSDAQIASAVARAYYYLGRDYDFDFNFESPNTLVCTEVLYRCYEGNREGYPLHFDLTTILGTPTLPAQNIVKNYVDAVQQNDPNNQLQLVAWIDTDRHKQPTSTLMIFNGSTTGPDHAFFEETLNRPGLTWEWERRQHGLRALITRPTEYLFYLCFSTTVGAALYQVTVRRRRKRAGLN